MGTKKRAMPAEVLVDGRRRMCSGNRRYGYGTCTNEAIKPHYMAMARSPSCLWCGCRGSGDKVGISLESNVKENGTTHNVVHPKGSKG